MSILDSGSRREFSTGAVRDMNSSDGGKGRMDLIPWDVVSSLYEPGNGDPYINSIELFIKTGDPQALEEVASAFMNEAFDNGAIALLELAKHFQEGCEKYGENNWQKGLPAWCYIDSGLRHYIKLRAGFTDERHDRAFLWNIVCCIWTCRNLPELNTYAEGNRSEGAHSENEE